MWILLIYYTIAHQDAFNAGVLHRDVSVGNILIVNGSGILIDWDLSKRLKDSNNLRQPTRTVSMATLPFSCVIGDLTLTGMQGTWQFLSAALIKSKTAPHTFIDDLESIFYVILWLSLFYSVHSMSSGQLTAFIRTVLDPEEYEGTGGSGKINFLLSRSDLRSLDFQGRPLLQPFLMDLVTLFSVRYEPEPTTQEKELALSLMGHELAEQLPYNKYQQRMSQLQSHAYVVQMFDKVIKNRAQWPEDPAEQHADLLPWPHEDKKRKTKTGWGVVESDGPYKKIQVEQQ